MSTQDEQNFFESFLDDYFAECEEHLTIIRRNLLELEPFVNQPHLKRSILDELFRSFHSLKGLSGMVGVREAEQLAHDMESYLRSLRDQQVILQAQGIDALIDGTKMLEVVINHYRTQTPAPNIESTLKKLHQLIPAENTTKAAIATQPTTLPAPECTPALQLNLKPEEIEQLTTGLNEGMHPWRFEFAPSAERSQQGINVNYVRERLQESGKLIHSAPRMMPNGGIIFDFLLISEIADPALANWQEDGLTYCLYLENLLSEPASPPVESAPQQQTLETAQTPPAIAPVAPDTPPTPQSPAIFPTLSTIPSPANVVRVDLTRLDELMRLVGELVITRSRLEDQIKSLKGTVAEPLLRPLKESNLALERQLRDLREGVMRVRLVPIGEIFARMQFVIRDLARENQKQVALELIGQNTEIDKFVVERMMDPLLHLVRNAVCHGLESAAERLECQKNPVGKIILRASTAGEMVMIEVEDDGRGVNLEAVAQRARSQGLISEQTQLDSTTLLEILCSSGFSTREQADLGSGRGVGMAVVKNTVQELGGFLSLETTVNQGTHFTIQLPLTLAIADALIVMVRQQTFAIPQSSVREVLQLNPSAIAVLENNQMIPYRNTVVPLINLAHLFNLAEWGNGGNGIENAIASSAHTHPLSVVIIGNGLNAVALLVDRILGQREIVVRPLSDPLVQVPAIAGATELGDRHIVLILDSAALLHFGRLSQHLETFKGTASNPAAFPLFQES